MLRFFIPLLCLATLNNGAEINSNKALGDIYSLGEDLVSGAVEIAANFGQVQLPMALKDILPYLANTAKGVRKSVVAFKKYVEVLQDENKSHSTPHNVNVPDDIFNDIIENGNNIEQGLTNIVNSDLINDIVQNSATFKPRNGNLVIPDALGQKLADAIIYIANQFEALKHDTIGLQIAFLQLSKSLRASNTKFLPYLYREAAKTSSQCASELQNVSDYFSSLVQLYKNIAKPDSTGDVVLPNSGFINITNAQIQKISNSYNKIANDIELFLEAVTSSSAK